MQNKTNYLRIGHGYSLLQSPQFTFSINLSFDSAVGIYGINNSFIVWTTQEFQ